VIRAATLTELFDFSWVLGSCARPAGKRVALLTHSGGPGAAAADACSRNGLELPPFSAHTLEKLKPLVPQTGSLNNPVDLTFSRDPLDYFKSIPAVLLEEPGIDSLLVYCFVPPKNMQRMMEIQGLSAGQIETFTAAITEELARNISALVQAHAKPVIGFTYQNPDMPVIKKLLEAGIPVLPSPERGARALAALVQYKQLTGKTQKHQAADG
jgi:acetate---CoA ligase (ADP-forming) subunit alpha